MKPRRHNMTREAWTAYGRFVSECWLRVQAIASRGAWLDRLHRVVDTDKQYD